MVARPGGRARRPGRDPRHADWRPRQLRAPVSIAWGEPMRFDGLPRNARGYREASAEIQREIRRLWEFLVELHALGRPRRAPPAVRSTPSEAWPGEPGGRSEPPLAGTVAIVGFPNVGKSTLVNRLTGRARPSSTRRPASRATARSSSASGTASASCSSTPAASTSPTRRRSRARSPTRRGGRSRRPTSSSSSSTPGGHHAGRRGDRRRSCAARASRCSCSRTRSTTRRGTPTRSSSTGSASATRSRSRRCTGTAPATCSTRSSTRCPGVGRARSGRGRDPRRHPRPAERRQVVAAERAARRGARDRLRGARARPATRSTPSSSAATRRSCSSTPPACGASAGSARGSSTTRSCARSRPPSGRTSRSSSIDASEGIVEQDLAVADVARKATAARRSSSCPSGTSPTIAIEDVRPRAPRRLRQRPPPVAVSAKTGRGVGALLDTVEELFERHTARVPTAELNRFLPSCARLRQPPSKNGKRLNLLYGTQVGRPAAALPALRQRPRPDHARLRLLGREPAARALRARGRARLHRLRAALMRWVVVGGGSWGTAFARLLADRGHEVTLACRDPSRRGDRRDRAATRATCDRRPARRHRRRADRGRAAGRRRRRRRRRPEPRLRRGRRARLPGDAPVLEPHEGPRPGDRRAALDCSSQRPSGRRPLRAEHGRGGRGGLPSAAVIASEDEALALRLQDAINSPSSASTSTRTSSASSSARRRRT